MKAIPFSISILLGLLLIQSSLVLSQTVSGQITDANGSALQDAYIWVGDGTKHAHSDAFGRFSLREVASGDTLRASFLGFEDLLLVLDEESFTRELLLVMDQKFFELDQVVITNDHRFINKIAEIDLQTQPVKSSQELLQRVPGLFISQHAGGGKAEQIFLRGFDIDHGTDIRISVDGMPVNMVSHAHGQGYADLHFIIPETIESLDFGKGPYYADQGNLNTAGYVAFRTKEQLEESMAGIEYGQFNTFRTVGLLDLLPGMEKQDAYIAGEYLITDGPFESAQHFNRTNVLGKYNIRLANSGKLSLTASHFQSKWDASGQIPQRAVASGMINRFGAIDDTEGGNTSRSNILLSHLKALTPYSYAKTTAYYSHYAFELYSNFTFFLEDPVNGDQIGQREERNLFGFETLVHKEWSGRISETDASFGAGLRYDNSSDNELSHTVNRQTTLNRLSYGDIYESNAYVFGEVNYTTGKWLISPGFRADYFNFEYSDRLASAYKTLSETKLIASPKINVSYNPNRLVQLFIKSGIGFHSNDTRVVIAKEGQDILPLAFGADAGFVWKPAPRLFISGAVWYLFMEQEFVYVGDAGVVEPGGETRRVGVDANVRYQPADWVFVDADANYTLARSVEAAEKENYIPLAPNLTAIAGVTIKHPSGLSAGLRTRYIADRPANEDNSIVAEGYLIVDGSVSYAWKKITLGIQVENLFDAEWNEAQFATESRLKDEAESVEELHFTPRTPFALSGKLTYKF